MNWGFLVLCCLWFGGFAIHMIKHGEPNIEKYNMFTRAIAILLEAVLVLWAMHWKVS